MLAQVIEKLSATTRSEDKTLGGFNSQQKDFGESGEMRRVIREELQHIVSEEPRHFDCFSRQFRNHRNFSCFDCSGNGHTMLLHGKYKLERSLCRSWRGNRSVLSD